MKATADHDSPGGLFFGIQAFQALGILCSSPCGFTVRKFEAVASITRVCLQAMAKVNAETMFLSTKKISQNEEDIGRTLR